MLDEKVFSYISLLEDRVSSLEKLLTESNEQLVDKCEQVDLLILAVEKLSDVVKANDVHMHMYFDTLNKSDEVVQ